MRDAAREVAHGLHLLRLAQHVLSGPLFGDVASARGRALEANLNYGLAILSVKPDAVRVALLMLSVWGTVH